MQISRVVFEKAANQRFPTHEIRPMGEGEEEMILTHVRPGWYIRGIRVLTATIDFYSEMALVINGNFFLKRWGGKWEEVVIREIEIWRIPPFSPFLPARGY